MERQAKIENQLCKDDNSICEDEFVCLDDVMGIVRQAAERTARRALAQAEELMRARKWQEMIELFHPMEEKMPELVEAGQDCALREKVAFAMGQVKMFDQAIDQLRLCLEREPASFRVHSSLAYTAYNCLYAAKNREIMLSGKLRKKRIELAHRHFGMAQNLRPDGVTNYYRQAMLYLQLEDKPRKAYPLFKKAIANWEALDEDKRQRRHQEAKNYVKALYNGAKAALEIGRCEEGLELIKKCLAADEASNHLERQNKYFALGKLNFQLNRYEAARDALKFARQCNDGRPADHVTELLARTYLAMGGAEKARQEICKVPPKRKRPYIAWTEADILLQLGKVNKARAVLQAAREKDGRSRHKTCVKMAGIAYLAGDFTAAMQLGAEADEFFRKQWMNHCGEGLFWKAVGALKAGRRETAAEALDQLQRHFPDHPRLGRLQSAIGRMAEDGKDGCKKEDKQPALRPVG